MLLKGKVQIAWVFDQSESMKDDQQEIRDRIERVYQELGLIDSAKAASLGLHRALFYNEQEGYLETFRPYALPDRAWFDGAGRALRGE